MAEIGGIPVDGKEIIGVPEVAKMFGTSQATVCRMANKNQIPHRKIGKRFIFSMSTLLEWLKNTESEVS